MGEYPADDRRIVTRDLSRLVLVLRTKNREAKRGRIALLAAPDHQRDALLGQRLPVGVVLADQARLFPVGPSVRICGRFNRIKKSHCFTGPFCPNESPESRFA